MITGQRDASAGGSAEAAWRRVRANRRCAPTKAIDAAWSHYANKARWAAPEDQPRIARQARAVMDAFGLMDWRHAETLAEGYTPPFPERFNSIQLAAHVARERAEVMASHPALAEYQAERDALAAAAAERQRHGTERAAAEARRVRPSVVLGEIRATGAVLALDEQGNIIAPAGSTLSAYLLAELRDHKPAIVAILKAEAEAAAEAARPVVLA